MLGGGGAGRGRVSGGRVRGVLGNKGDPERGVAIEREGDQDRVSMKFKNIHDSSKSTHEIQSRNEGYDLNTIDLS